jgi:hypothetical protein
MKYQSLKPVMILVGTMVAFACITGIAKLLQWSVHLDWYQSLVLASCWWIVGQQVNHHWNCKD